MSLILTVHVSEGIVMASDRRTTYANTQEVNGRTVQRIGVHVTDTTDKTFICPNGAGISVCGEASLLGKPITGYVQDMIRTAIGPDCRVEEMPGRVIEYFGALPAVPNTDFIAAGYDTSGNEKRQRIFKFSVRSKRVESINTEAQGATWAGESLTLTRLLKPVAVREPNGKYVDLPFEEVLWGYFTLQDAVDFARYAVETTIQTMRFKNVVETVGGAVDILVITPGGGAGWLQKEELR